MYSSLSCSVQSIELWLVLTRPCLQMPSKLFASFLVTNYSQDFKIYALVSDLDLTFWQNWVPLSGTLFINAVLYCLWSLMGRKYLGSFNWTLCWLFSLAKTL